MTLADLTPNGKRATYSEAEARAVMGARLETRRQEIEETILLRLVPSLSDREANDPEYETGLRRAVTAGTAYGIAAIRLDDGEVPPIPLELLSQARTAAKHRVMIDVVLQRYISAQSIFNQILFDEADKDPGLWSAATHLAGSASLAFQALTAAASSEYARTSRSKLSTLAAARLDRLRRLLKGETVRTGDLGYDFSVVHIGAVAEGPGGPDCVRRLATAIDGRLLTAQPGGDTVWAWIGIREPIPRDEFRQSVEVGWNQQCPLGLGEFGQGIGGWRRTHEQAQVAFSHSAWRALEPVSYADVALEYTVSMDGLLSSSLRSLYLVPLETERDGGAALRATLRAYFATGRNQASAAAQLRVSRQAISNRLRRAEELLNCSLAEKALALELALRLER